MSNPAYIHPSAVVEEGATLGAGVKVWHFCHIMPGANLGEGTNATIAATNRGKTTTRAGASSKKIFILVIFL